MPENGIAAPSFRRDWRWLLLFVVLGYATAFGIRYLDLPKWDNDLLRVNGEYILATHDAYCWVAGAKGVGTGCGTPLAKLAAFVSETTGLSLGLVAFWAPAVVASLAAVVLVLWAWTLGGLEAGLCAGMIGAVAPGFFFRTRLGYYDTDIVTLLFPLFQSWFLAHWLSPWLASPAAFFRKRKDLGLESSRMPGLEWALLAGLAVRYGGSHWHANILDFNALVFCGAIFLALVLGRGEVRPRLLWGLSVYALAAFFGMGGLAASLGLTVFSRLAPRMFGRAAKLIPALVVLALVFFSTGPVYNVYTTARDQFKMYSKSVTETVRSQDVLKTPANTTDVPVQKPVYPGITQSVVEAQNLPLTQILDKLYVKVWIAVAGLAGFLLVMVIRPAALFLLPLAALSFTGVKLGARMSMFGGPVVALGLSLPLCWLALWLIGKRPWRRLAVTVLQAALGVALLWPLYNLYRTLGPTPILYKQHCLALRELEKISPPNSLVWTWWDWGYATMYYSGRMAFADGARHSGEYLYPLGLAL
ncbi:MAG: STT3 domain-containing protein, partial [Thermodesulfobacteriota bacterium]|nr:STT3 domain-containing protein [Thermodesulfobacteriota bacterium]